MADLLLEVLSEEIPSRMQPRARAELERLAGELLKAEGLEAERLVCLSTPRRLVLHASGLPACQPDRITERRGPRVDAPERARAGFLRSLEGLAYELVERQEKKGSVLYARIRESGRPAAEILAERLPELLNRFPWPKSMRWGAGEARWVRPIHSILCLLDGEIVAFSFAGVESGRTTMGHRFLAPEPIRIGHPREHRPALLRARVVLSPEERRRRIEEAARRLTEAEGRVPASDPELLEELVGLVEWPVVLMGRIDAAFMELPREVLITSMRQHQRYLAVTERDGALAPRFLVVANMEARDGGEAIRAGNERVLRARLWDARFFWDSDRRVLLEDRLPALRRVIFHARLGSLAEKAERMVVLAGHLAGLVEGADRIRAERAALLAKCDLVSGMVGEFPELQGIMGGYYAREQGEDEEVARAIAEHYAPQGPEDRCPDAPVSITVALADKIDTLAGFFAAGIRPTGSKDPFALRRAALGVIRLVLENRLRIALRPVFALAVDSYGERFAEVDRDAHARELLEFLADRLVVHLREEGIRHDLIRAVFGVALDDDLVRLLARLRSLARFVESEDGRNLLVAYRRARNIVAIEEKRDRCVYRGAVDPRRFESEEERRLHEELERTRRAMRERLEREDFEGAMAALAGLRPVVDAFFERVRVNVSDADRRRNRLLLLAELRSTFETVADFSRVEDRSAAAASAATVRQSN